MLHGADILYLLKEQPPRPVPLISDIGVRLPASLTATGRAILANLPRAQVRALFPNQDAFVDRTGHGPHTPAELRRLLNEDRRRGWSTEDGYVVEGFASVAAAAFGHDQRPTAAIGVTFAKRSRHTGEWPSIAHQVRAVAATLTRRLHGHQPG